MTISRRSPLVLILAALVLLGVIAGAAGLAYLFLRPAPPAAVGATASPGASQPASTAAALPTGAAGTIGPEASTARGPSTRRSARSPTSRPRSWAIG